MSKSKVIVENYTQYEVHFGPKKMSLREVFTTSDEDKADEVFKQKQSTGLYVDVFKIEIQKATKTTRMTKPE